MFLLKSYGSYKNTNALLFSPYFFTIVQNWFGYFLYLALACTTIYVSGAHISVNLIVFNHTESL